MKQSSEPNQTRQLLLSLTPIQAIAVGLPAINSLLVGFISGHFLGPSALAAIGFVGPLMYLVTMIGTTLATGSQVKGGHQLGGGDSEGLSRTFNTTFVCALVIGLIVSSLLIALRNVISVLLGASDELIELTCEYILGLAPGVLFSLLFTVLLSFLQLERAEKTSTIAIVALVIVNTSFSLIAISVLNWGLIGAAIATTLANLVAVLICLIHFICKGSIFRFSLHSFDVNIIKDVIYLGSPSAVEPACSLIRDRVINQIVFSLGGTTAMAAMTVALNISNGIGNTISGGFTGASNLISSVLVGERDIESLRSFPKTIINAMFPIFIIAYVVLFIFARPLALAFGAEPDKIELYVTAIRVLNLWFITDSFKVPSISIYQSLGKIKLVSILFALIALVFPILVAFGGKVFGFAFLMCFSWIAEVGAIAACIVYYCIKRKKFPKSIYTITDIPHTMAVPSIDRYNATIRNIKDATDISEKITDFCSSKGLSQKTAMLCGLCIEEISVDCILHGFTRGKKNSYSIDVRTIYENNGISVMLRNNCPHFDPKEWLDMYGDENPERSLGLRLTMKCAKEMNYSSALGMNIITIKV